MRVETVVFFSSMCVMVLELVAARYLAHHLGYSIYTWTSTIGVVLAGLSIGHYMGGKMADEEDRETLLSSMLIAGSACTVSILVLGEAASHLRYPSPIPWSVWVLFNTTFVFFLPAAVLGTIAPIAAAIALRRSDHPGETVGVIYACGASGSIVGTFLTGFVLLDVFGLRAVVCIVALALAVLALVAVRLQAEPNYRFGAFWLLGFILIALVAIGPWAWAVQAGVFLMLRPDLSALDHYDESGYSTIRVYSADDTGSIRILMLDNLIHSIVAVGEPSELGYAYERVYEALTTLVIGRTRQPTAALFLGGGGFVFPRYFEYQYPGSRIDVAEIDPAVKRAAQLALGLPSDRDTSIKTHLMDARRFVDSQLEAPRQSASQVNYSFVYGDAFNHYMVPFHLTTREFNDKIASLLTPDGIYLINVIDLDYDGSGQFLSAFVATLRETFARLYVFRTSTTSTARQRETFVVACAGEESELSIESIARDARLSRLLVAWSEPKRVGGTMAQLLAAGAGRILTDDHAPVESLLARVASTQ
jgi:spermidine synthase